MLNRNRIAVLGAGTMGPGIAAVYAAGGYEVSLYSRTQKTLDRAAKVISGSLAFLAEEGILTDGAALAAEQRLSFTTVLEVAVQSAWYVVETVSEVAEAKADIYARLDRLLPRDVIIASDTSAMDIFALMPASRRPHTVIAHFFAPAHILPLVEVVRGPETLDEVMDATVELHRACGKTPIRMDRFVPGFIVNRLQRTLGREVTFLLEGGYCTPRDLDLAVKTSLMPRGMLLGLVQRMDFTGLDTMANGYRSEAYVPADLPPGVPPMIQERCDRGDLGVKTGKGFFDYSGQPYEEVLLHRDRQLLQSVRLAEAFMADPLETK